MTVSTGMRLGPYEIVAPVGAGGMGEVYRGWDTRLHRTVAIKLLRDSDREDPQRRQRFEREARAIASLSHPHICSVYDVGQRDDVDFLVTEYLEGQTVADRLRKGPIPLDQLLRYAVEITGALAYAHSRGLIHRDVKPANIMLTKTGAKLLDFGLAKLRAPEVARLASSTVSLDRDPLTADGTIVGTFQYMAPEQVEGKEADPRTDIFALGVVIYEMATGRAAFEGTSQASLISAILRDHPPPIRTRQPMAPPALDRVVTTCLAKDPEERWQTAHDVGVQLKWIAESRESEADLRGEVHGPTVRRRFWMIVAAVATLTAAGLAVRQFRAAPATPAVVRFSLSLPGAEGRGFGSPPAVSADGRHIAFVAPPSPGAEPMLWVRPIDMPDARPLSGTEGATNPFWSPDGQLLGYFARGALKTISAQGGTPQTLAEAPYPFGGAWGRDGVIIYTPRPDECLFRVSASGGKAAPFTTLDRARGEGGHVDPSFLPDGHRLLYLVLGSEEARGLYVRSLDRPDATRVTSGGSLGQYVGTHLLFVREGTLMAQALDSRSLRPTGEPVPLADHVRQNVELGWAFFGAAAGGTQAVLAYRESFGADEGQFAWFDRSGRQLETLGPVGPYSGTPSLSPDEQRAAVFRATQVERADIYVMERGGASKVTSDPSGDFNPIWSADGEQIVFASNRRGWFELFVKDASGATSERLLSDTLLPAGISVFPTDWSRDGQLIVFQVDNPKTWRDIWTVRLSDRKASPFLANKYSEQAGVLSPDGRWMAYESDESGKWEVYVCAFPSAGGKRLISSNGGLMPKWRRDGKEIFYLAPDAGLMAVPLEAGSSLKPGPARRLFASPVSVRSARGGFASGFAVSADGSRFLFRVPVGYQRSPELLQVVINWTSLLAPK